MKKIEELETQIEESKKALAELKVAEEEKTKEKSEENPNGIIGETINFEPLRRLQVVDGTPSDLQGVVRKAQDVARWDVKKEHNWMGIAIAFVVIVFGVMFGLMFLTKIDFGNLFGGGGGGGGGSETVTMAIGMLRMAMV